MSVRQFSIERLFKEGENARWRGIQFFTEKQEAVDYVKDNEAVYTLRVVEIATRKIVFEGMVSSTS